MRPDKTQTLSAPLIEAKNAAHLGYTKRFEIEAIDIFHFRYIENVTKPLFGVVNFFNWNVTTLQAKSLLRTDYTTNLYIVPFCQRKRIANVFGSSCVWASVSYGQPPRWHITSVGDENSDTPYNWIVRRVSDNWWIAKINKSAVSQP